MDKSATLTLKIINDTDVMKNLPKTRALTEAQKDFIRFVSRIAVEEFIKKEKGLTHGCESVLRLREVIKLTGLSRSSIYKGMNNGNFPKPVNLGIRSIGWKESQISAWLNERPA